MATTSHFIIHLTKGAKGYELVKTIYNDFANVGTVFDGIHTYTFNPRSVGMSSSLLFDDTTENIDKLAEELYKNIRGIILMPYLYLKKIRSIQNIV